MKSPKIKFNWKGVLLWSNQFYGICAVLLTITSSLSLLHQFPSVSLLLLIHIITVVYYTHAYLLERKDGIYNERSAWYEKNKNYLFYRQLFLTAIGFYLAIVQCGFIGLLIQSNTWVQLLFFASLFVCLLYYFPSLSNSSKKSLRQLGILKSISIAWAWTFTSCILPIWYVSNLDKMLINLAFWLYIIPLFIFILILAILFDIKDLNRDTAEQTDTIVVKVGKDRIVHTVIVPLLVIYALLVGLNYYLLCPSIIYLIHNLGLTGLIYMVARAALKKQAIYMSILLIDGLIIIKAMLSCWELFINR